MNVGFLGLGSMGLPMAINLVKKNGHSILGYDVVPKQMEAFVKAGGISATPEEIYKTCPVILQCLPTHETIIHSVEQAIALSPKGTIIVDTSSTAPNIVKDLYAKAKEASLYLLDSPISGGNPLAIAGTLAIMVGGDVEIFENVKPLLECMGHPVYTGPSGSGDTTKLINNIIGGAILTALAEGYALAAKAGLDLQTTFEATRTGFVGGPLYENKIPKMIARDYTPGARIAVHRKDMLNAKRFAHSLGVDLPLADVTLHIMDWMVDNGYVDFDQCAMVKYFEEKMNVTVGKN